MGGANDPGKAGKHLSVAGHTHIHRHLGELYTTGNYWGSASSGTDYEILFRNPDGSGKSLEIITITVTGDVGWESREFKDFSFPGSGTTSLTPINMDSGRSDDINGDVEYGTDNADGGTEIPPPTISPAADEGPSRIPAIEQSPKADYAVAEGEVFAISVTPQANGKIAIGVTLAEFDRDRNF